MIKCFNNQARLFRSTKRFGWWNNQAESYLKHVANVAFALPVIQASLKRTFSGLKYILNELIFGLKEDLIRAIMF